MLIITSQLYGVATAGTHVSEWGESGSAGERERELGYGKGLGGREAFSE